MAIFDLAGGAIAPLICGYLYDEELYICNLFDARFKSSGCANIAIAFIIRNHWIGGYHALNLSTHQQIAHMYSAIESGWMWLVLQNVPHLRMWPWPDYMRAAIRNNQHAVISYIQSRYQYDDVWLTIAQYGDKKTCRFFDIPTDAFYSASIFVAMRYSNIDALEYLSTDHNIKIAHIAIVHAKPKVFRAFAKPANFDSLGHAAFAAGQHEYVKILCELGWNIKIATALAATYSIKIEDII